MRRTILAVAVMAPMVAAAYACSTDTFTGGDGSAEGGGGVVSQGDFCADESLYIHSCFGDAACAIADLANCGTVYSAYDPAFLTALAQCMHDGKVPCNGDVNTILSSQCMSDALASYSNDSSALTSLAQDYCKICKGSSGGCVDQFASKGQVGYVASFFIPTIITQMDKCEKALDGGKLTIGDASLNCDEQTFLCEIGSAANALPASACNDR